ncbi:MAG: glycosyltransferase family 39 protein [candidate division WOR-3 bacterium]|nr:glycosyltransferase family 39 protein [candidate division WOR-3 bacterium]
MPRKKYPLLLILLVIIYTILSILLFDPKLFTGGDNAVYIILAESIVTGKGYKNIYLPDEPPHTQYPPGFPIILSIPLMIFGKNILVLKFIIFLMGLFSFVFFYYIIRKLFREWLVPFVLYYLFIPSLIKYNHWILSEIPFLFFSLGSFYFLLKFYDKKQLFYFIVSSLFGIYAFFIRTAGISLIFGFALFLILKKEYKYLFLFLFLFLLFFIPWEIRNANISDGTGYLSQLLAKNPYQMELGTIGIFDFFKRLWQNFYLYTFTIIPKTLIPLLNSKTLIFFAGLFILIFLITGFVLKIKNFGIFESYLVFGTGVLLAWPEVWSSERFILPLIPIYLITIYTSLAWVQHKLKSKYFIAAACGLLTFLNLISTISESQVAIKNNLGYIKGDRYAGYPVDWRRYFEVIMYIKTNIPDEKVIMARKPEFVYLLSNHKSFCYPFTTNLNEVIESIKKADYIILDKFLWTQTTLRYLLPAIQTFREDFEIVYKTNYPEFYLLKIKK